jgi:hypothetical protein
MRWILGVLFLVYSFAAKAQTLQATWQKITDLPTALNESSGLIRTDKGTFWSHGDGGNASEIYEFDTTGQLLRTLEFYNATNIDWEDMGQDEQGNIWLADLGNNDSDRDNLALYKIENPANHDSARVHVSRLDITYEDQDILPSPIGNRNFDVEGIACFGDSILLITKNRSYPNSGFAKIYWVPAREGRAVAKIIDSIFTETHIQLGRITGADYFRASELLVLTALHQVFVVPFDGGKIEIDSIKRYRFDFHNNQFESIVMLSGNEGYMTAEKPSMLCRFRLKDANFTYPLRTTGINTDIVYVSGQTMYFSKASFSGEIKVYDVMGRCLYAKEHRQVSSVLLPLEAGRVYLLELTHNKERSVRKIVLE